MRGRTVITLVFCGFSLLAAGCIGRERSSTDRTVAVEPEESGGTSTAAAPPAAKTDPVVPAFPPGYVALPGEFAIQTPKGYYLTAIDGGGRSTAPVVVTVATSAGAFVGLLLAGRYATGPDLWELVRITGWTPATQTATVNRNLTNTWPIGSLYRCWYDIRGADQLHVLPEFSADTTAMTVTPIFVDWSGQIRTWALDLVLTNSAVTGTAGEIQETGYRHGLVRSTAVKGLLGAKLRVKSTANGSVSLWLARS